MSVTQPVERVHDLVGVGFGPSNLALAIAVTEHNRTAPAGRRLSAAFIERQESFGWHRGMLIDGATMQISFLKDLATPRNPTSGFSFVSYLHDKGRLVDFTNHQCLFPSRVEFHDYLEWCAARFADDVAYGHEVTEIRAAHDGAGSDVTELEVRTTPRRGSAPAGTWRARNLVLATGLRPHLPAGAVASDRVWHNEQLVRRAAGISPDSSPRFMVVGAGQSAAETLEYLHRRFPRSPIYSVFAKYGFTPADDSPFVNGIFDPGAVPTFFNASRAVKEAVVAHHRNTNYSVADTELIEELYRRSYQERVLGEERLRFLNLSRVLRVEETGEHLVVSTEFLPTGEVREDEVDVLVYATGYRPADPLPLLGSLAAQCKRDAEDRVQVDLDYRVSTTGSVTCGIYLQGPTEHTHGLSSTLLSNTAVRAGAIVESIAAHR
ncbi:lysine N(6)-hydroxylase/L-ornithine N(5)-oxygenase family protein [Lentzea sp. NPDC059081]|uniref:lysine N(6)-hydroxylase/L-ornithine N(5)-oxygenase family protein n=1 Tax=Lentzea sp. NPDC059081 TaxID=3346719 RepID=UPI00369FA9B1